MAENPDTWGEAERVVADALEEADRNHFDEVCGLSAVRVVTDALRKADLLVSEQLQARAQAADAYAQQNKDVHRENMMLRDENVELRRQLATSMGWVQK
jgi:hypothetical protein